MTTCGPTTPVDSIDEIPWPDTYVFSLRWSSNSYQVNHADLPEEFIDTVAARVADGARWLDRERPDWFRRINQDDLDLSDCQFCVAGQVFGDYASEEFDRNLPGADTLGFEAAAVQHGFESEMAHKNVDTFHGLYLPDLSVQPLIIEYILLEAAWDREIWARFGFYPPMQTIQTRLNR